MSNVSLNENNIKSIFKECKRTNSYNTVINMI